MSEDRDYRIALDPNRPPHIRIRGREVKRIWFSPYYKWRHSALHVVVAGDDSNDWRDIEMSWSWCEMPRELADLCRLLHGTQTAIENLLGKLDGDEGDDKEWRCE